MNYFEWLAKETPSRWWHDSAIPGEIDEAIKNGATGVTTNPVLTYKALQADPAYWEARVKTVPQSSQGTERVEALMNIVTSEAAAKFKAIYEQTNGGDGYALAQVNPANAGDTKAMLEQGLRYASWAENIAVKMPTVKASLPVVEELASRGIAVCTTLNFSVSQARAAAEAYERGAAKARKKGILVKPCLIVQQGGRLDDYLEDVVKDNGLEEAISADDIQYAGNAVCKRSYDLLQEMGSSAFIMPAGLRGLRHLTAMAGGRVVYSLQTRIQRMAVETDLPKVECINEQIDEEITERLSRLDEFAKAYDPYGMKEEDFIKFGVTQRTLSQFLWTGWTPLETYASDEVSARWF